jgi:murein DD-endopeptidase MepM/ murein hydrolase activator NlpD
MKKLWYVLALAAFLSPIISGCHRDLGQTPTPGVTETSATADRPDGEPATATEAILTPTALTATPENESTPVATASPTFVIVKDTPTAFERLDCGEVFCQVEWQGFLSRPISQDFRNTIDPTYPYASTKDGTLDVHIGVEFVNSSGTPVIAGAKGEVVFAGQDDQVLLGPYPGFYGNVVILRHPGLYDDQDVFNIYGHLSVIDVEEGEFVATGDVLGKVGATGYAIGSHLHFEVRLGQNDAAHTVNPVLWFSPLNSEDEGNRAALAGVITSRDGTPLPELGLALERLNSEGKPFAYYYPKTYNNTGINGHPELGENFTLYDLPPGNYRLAFVYGTLYEYFFTLEPGHLGFIRVGVD